MLISNKTKKSLKHPSKQQLKEPIFLSLLILIGFLLRYWWITHIPTEQLYDFATYYDIAKNVAHGLGYTYQGQPIAFQGMGYSYALGLFFKLLGSDSEWTAKILNVLLSTLTIPIVFMMAKRMSSRPLVRWGAVVVTALLPHHIAYCNSIGTEVMAAFLLALTLLVQLSGKGSENTKRVWLKYVLLGILTAAMALVKPFYMAYPVILGLSEWLMTKNWRQSLKMLLVTYMCMCLVIAPWTYRNYKIFGRMIPICYSSGATLYWNNNSDNVIGGFMKLTDIHKTPELQAAVDRELQNGAKSVKLSSNLELILGPEAKRWIRTHPLEFMQLAVIRVHSTFFSGTWDLDAWTFNKLRESQTTLSPLEYTRAVNNFRSINDMLLNIIASFSLVFCLYQGVGLLKGLVGKRRYPSWIVLPTMNLAFLVAVYMVFEGQPRYNFPVLFLMTTITFIVIDQMSSSKLTSPS